MEPNQEKPSAQATEQSNNVVQKQPNHFKLLTKYSDCVLMEGWEEQARIQEAMLTLYYKDRRANRLWIEKTRRRACFLLRDITISYKFNWLAYEQYLQIKAPFIKFDNVTGVVLSSTLAEDEDGVIEVISRTLQLSWSTDFDPSFRNVFAIRSIENDKTDIDLVNYGSEFYLVTANDAEHPALYLNVRFITPGVPSTHSGHSAVTFSLTPDDGCIWTALNTAITKERDDTMGLPIPVNSNVLLKNIRTGLYLAVEPNYIWHSLFGPELEVSAHNYMTPTFLARIENIVSLEVKPGPTRNWPPEFTI